MKSKTFIYGMLSLCLATLFLSSGCRRDRVIEDAAVPRLHLEVRGGPGTGETINVQMETSRASLNVARMPLVNEFEITNIELVQVDLGLAVLIQMDELASRRLFRASVEHNGARVALLVGGVPVGLRRLDGPIQDGNFFIFVDLDDEATEQLVVDMRETLEKIQRRRRR